ncbi:MAG TPA: glycosyl hydrolase, partial [Puia sp.]|nr:glycosyl hydrolase [Puia sp.]
HDYDLTLSELLGLHFLRASKDWMESRGLLHRTQAYGLPLDMIASAGLASIPETESMLGPEANLKIMTSGGHLYNRPIESAESVVFAGRAYMMTPQKIRIAVDKLFAAGVNQVIYHGVPYRYTPPELGPEGWYPFSTPMIPMVNFSANLGEGNIFWKFQKEVNEYVTRTQYALRAGRPHADVLIYFPFMDANGVPDNPEEILTKGVLPGVEGPLAPNKEAHDIAREQWAAQVYPVINALESHGVTWDWVNDASIHEFRLTPDKQIDVRGNHYQALILAGDSLIEMGTAQKIADLTKQGMRMLVFGALPTRQPSYLNWKDNDARTAHYIQTAMRSVTAYYGKDRQNVIGWIKELQTPVRFVEAYSCTRQTERDMGDGSRVQFIWNKSDHWQTISLQLDSRFKSSFWLNAVDATIRSNTGSHVSYRLAPYSSILLYASTQTGGLPKQGQLDTIQPCDTTNALLTVGNWSLKADSVQVSDNALFDWRSDNRLKYSDATGDYKADFHWTREKGSSRIYLDLGQVYFTAEVLINGRSAGTVLFSPYMIDITDLVVQGDNRIEVRITPGALNSYIGKAKAGDNRYKQFKNKDDQLMAAGLLGPVVIRSDQP